MWVYNKFCFKDYYVKIHQIKKDLIMRAEISRVSNSTDFKNLSVTKRKHKAPSGTEIVYYTIELDRLENLLKIKDIFKENVIVCNSLMDDCGFKVEIFDDYL